ncbi:hypothetical protein WJU16_18330 [Chitinophaga pollutisoli]|uniref:Uncharacterized protein n=1 Tax=Chitinophaga pollutisoli TaxID=3133966 RepID=A0ABZ2YJZ5_9BACT
MFKFFLTIQILLLTAFTAVNAQQTHQPKVEGKGSLKDFVFAPKAGAAATSARSSLKVSTKPKEATLASPQAVKQHIFPGSNGGGVPRSIAGARKATAKAAPAGQLPSSASDADAAQKDKAGESAKAAAKTIDPAAQGKEPSLHFEKPKATTPKN